MWGSIPAKGEISRQALAAVGHYMHAQRMSSTRLANWLLLKSLAMDSIRATRMASLWNQLAAGWIGPVLDEQKCMSRTPPAQPRMPAVAQSSPMEVSTRHKRRHPTLVRVAVLVKTVVCV